MKNIDVTRSDFLKAAEELFGRMGYEKTSISDISSKLGKSKTALYYHFKDKHQIYNDVIQAEFNGVKEKLRTIIDADYPDDNCRMADYLAVRLSLIQNMSAYRQFIQSDISKGDRRTNEIVDNARGEFDSWETDFFKSLCEDARRRGALPEKTKPEAFALTLINILKGLEMQYYLSDDKESMETTYEGLIGLLTFRK